jgi:outer membrane receptor for ferrienterochelin and colicins
MKRYLFAALLPMFGQQAAQAQTPQAPLGASASPTPSADPSAEDLSDIQGMLDEPILSTASKAQESASNAPATTVSISADDLRRYGIRSLDEAINYLSMGMMTQNPLHSVDVGARGVLLTADYGNHVLLLVNGHVMNEQWNGTAYFERGAAVPFEMIDHIEMILGPGSVLYGSNAMLGVINIITKRAKDWSGGHLVAESELPISYRGMVGVGHEFSLLGQDAELTLGLEYYSQSGPTFNFGPQAYGDDAVTMMPKRFNPSGSNAGTWGGAADKSYWTKIPSGYARLVVGRFALDVRAANYKRGTPFVSLANQTSGDFNDANSWERDRWISADLKHSQPLNSVAHLKSRLYADVYQYDQHVHASAAEDCADGQVNGCVRDGLGIARWVGLEEQLNLDWTHDNRFTTLVGADSRLRYTGNQLDLHDAATGIAPADAARVRKTEGSLGVYLQQGIRLAPTFDLSTGVRLDADQRFGHHFSPRGAAAWDA